MMLLEEILNQIEQSKMNKSTLKKWERLLVDISDKEIIDCIDMAEMSKIVYVLSIKYKQEPVLIPIDNDLMIRVGECNVANMPYLAVFIHFLNIKNNILSIEGNTYI